MKNLLRIFLFMMIPFVMVACGPSTSSDTATPTGSIAFQLTWDASAVPSAHRAPPAGVTVCDWYNIATIQVRVNNESGTQVGSANPQCSAGSATLGGIPVGTVSVTIGGIVAGNRDWSGQATGVVVTANQTTNAGQITMIYVGNDNDTPTVLLPTSPAADAVDVALDTTITATFSEDVVAGSVTASTFLLDGGAESGSVTYDSATRTATFKPTFQLMPLTPYTATIETGVEDLAGHPAAKHDWSFTTADCTSYADFSGSWDYSATTDDTDCGGSIQTSTGTFTIVQAAGSSSATVTFDGHTFPASVCNNTMTATTTYPDGAGTTTETIHATISGDAITSFSTWTYTETGWGTCSGTTDITATRGAAVLGVWDSSVWDGVDLWGP